MTEFSTPDARQLAARLLGVRIVELTSLHRGRNSRVFRAELEGGDSVVVKQFHRTPGDPRDRLGVEVAAFRFLYQNEIDCVPRVLAHDRANHIAVYEHLDGATFPPERASELDVDGMAAFVGRLAALRDAPGADALPLASEATLSLHALAAVIDRRLQRLGAVAAGRADLGRFLADELEPARERAEARARRGPASETDLPVRLRTLSPSDLGFHNAIRRPNGSLAYVDFEYFGWDEPSKLVSDFLLHPAMDLEDRLRRRFAEEVAGHLEDATLPDRVAAAHGLHAVRWALILLNEFVPHELDRRRFAGEREAREELLGRQLSKARGLLEQVDNHP